MTNPLIDELLESSAIPQVDIALPTRGYFYPEGEVLGDDCDPDHIVVHPISVLEESTFSDPLIVISGHAVSGMIKRVTPVIAEPSKLCEIDIQAILIASRIASHGPDMKLDHVCQACEYKNRIQLDLNNHIMNFGSYTPEEFNKFDIELSKVGQKVRLRPILYEDSVALNMEMIRSSIGVDDNIDDNIVSPEFIENYKKRFDSVLSTNLGAIIASIQYVVTKSGQIVTDRKTISDWLKVLSPDGVKTITRRIGEINDDISSRSKITYTCQECGVENSFHVELDPQKLFMPAEDTKAEMSSSAKTKNIKKPTRKPSKTSQRLS